MKTHSMKIALLAPAITLYATNVFGHTDGSHTGGLVQQLMHILQSTDHLFIILALAVAVSVLVRQVRKRRD
jgi:hydrogenase/urease accessory protein HupE